MFQTIIFKNALKHAEIYEVMFFLCAKHHECIMFKCCFLLKEFKFENQQYFNKTQTTNKN